MHGEIEKPENEMPELEVQMEELKWKIVQRAR